MFLKQDWAYFFAGFSLIIASAIGEFIVKGFSAWLFSIIGLALAALPMIQRLEVSNNAKDGLSIRFERPKVDEIIRHMESVVNATNNETNEELRKALKELKAAQDGGWTGLIIIFVVVIIGIGYCSSENSSKKASIQNSQETQLNSDGVHADKMRTNDFDGRSATGPLGGRLEHTKPETNDTQTEQVDPQP